MNAHADHEARLRALLHEAADSLEPHGDGLERIHARLRQPRPRSIAWAHSGPGDLVMHFPAWLQDAIYQVADWLRPVVERFAPAQAPGRHRSRSHGLLRPLAAMAVVMFIVAAGTYVAIDASTAIFPSGSSSQQGGGGGAGGGGHNHHSGGPGTGAAHDSTTQPGRGSGKPGPTASPSCKTTAAKPGGSANSPAAQQTPSTGTNTSTGTTSSPAASDSPASGDTSTSTDTSSPSPTDTTDTTSPAPSAATSPAPPVNPPTSSPTTPLTKPSC